MALNLNPDRIRAIQGFHLDRAATGNDVAILNISITADAQVRVNLVAVEPEHAAAMLEQLHAAAARLTTYARNCGVLQANRLSLVGVSE